MKLLIMINLLLSLFACVQLARALHLSYLLSKQGGRSLPYKLSAIIIVLLILANFLSFTFGISRIVNNFAPYATKWITTTTIVYHLIAACVGHLFFTIYRNKLLDIKKLKA